MEFYIRFACLSVSLLTLKWVACHATSKIQVDIESVKLRHQKCNV